MRITYLHQYFNTPEMSGGTRSYEMARRLVAAGHEVNIFTSDRDVKKRGSGWYVTEEAGIIVHWLPVPYSNQMSYPNRIRSFLQYAWNTAKRGASIAADVVFATSTPLTIVLPGVYAARRLDVPFVFEVRDLWPEIPIAIGALRTPFLKLPARWLERFAYSNADAIVALSPGIKRGVVRTGYPENCVAVIPNSADIQLFDVAEETGRTFRYRFYWLQDRPLVVYTGTLGLMNGVDYLARVAHEVSQIMPEVRFLTVGSGNEQRKVERVARELGVLKKNFFMSSPVPKQEIPAILSAADVATSLFIDLPEMWSNSANKFFDALASGTPVAINYRGWQANLLENSGAGIVLPADDIPEASRKLVSLLQDRDRLKDAANASRMLAIERFDRDKLAVRLENVLLQAVRTNYEK